MATEVFKHGLGEPYKRKEDARFIRGVLTASTRAPGFRRTTTQPAPATRPSVISMPLVDVANLVKHFVRNAGFLRKRTLVKAESIFDVDQWM